MHRQDFSYSLPEALIADAPVKERTGSRLLCLDGTTGACTHRRFPELLDQLTPGDLLIFNDTKVIPARLFGHKASGGKVEILIERLSSEQRALAHIRSSRSPKADSIIGLENDAAVRVAGRRGELFELDFGQPVAPLLEAIGHTPLPPYIERDDTPEDQQRYQTVYGRNAGAVAAPTAGLHFSEDLLAAIASKNVGIAFVTLHVGAGTFQPVRVDNVLEHPMHSEWMTVSHEVCEQVNRARAEGRRVVAVGTTTVRSLETAARQSGPEQLQAYEGETAIFIYPGYEFQLIDALITNFHLPESTLLMLVSAFAGHAHTLAAYRQAVEQGYRFCSYGDAMLITRNPNAPLETVGTP